MTAASEPQRRILREFTNTLEQCPRIREESSWELLVGNIGSRLGTNLNLRKQATTRADVIELVRVCARLPHGLELIADELKFLDPLAPEVPVLLRLSDEWQAAAPHSGGGVSPANWGGIPPRNLNFTGREELLRQLHDRLEPGAMTAVLPQALRGLGGVGKSQLAAEYAYRHRADFDIIWWVPAELPVQTQASLVELGQRLNLTIASDVNVAVRMVTDALAGNARAGRQIPPNWLLIFDNAESPQDLLPYLPTGGPGRILITSRNSEWLSVARPLEVDVFQREESIELLRRRGPELSRDDADRLAAALGDLPLAIEQAAVWRAETGIPADEYIQLLNEKQIELLKMPGPLDYRKSVAAAWNLSLDELRARNPTALRVLQVCSFFAPEPIPRNILVNAATVSELALGIPDQLRLNEALRDINRFALARIDHRTNSIQMHRLVQAVLVDGMPLHDQEAIRHGAHMLLAAEDPDAPDDTQHWPKYSQLYPHVMASKAMECQSPALRKLVANMTNFLYLWGEIRASLEISQWAYEDWRTRLGPDHEDTLRIGRWCGFMLWANGRFRRSSEFNAALLDIHRRTLGGDHQDTLLAMDSVAGDHRAQGDFAGGLKLSRTIYERCVERFGNDDPLTLNAAHNVGVSLRLSGLFTEAREIDEITYRRKVKVLGADHLLSLLTQVGLTLDQRESGEYLAANATCGDIVARYRRLYGHLNPATLRAILHQAGMRRKAGDLVGGMQAANEAFDGLVNQYGRDHHHTIAAALSRSTSLRLAGELEAARQLGEEVLDRYRRLLGREHPHTLAAMTQLAVTLRLLGNLAEGRTLDEAAFDGLRIRLGDTHPSAIIAGMNLASDLFGLGQFEAAHGLDAAIVERAGRVLGLAHPITLSAKANLAQDLRALERDDGTALRSEVRLQAIARLGAEHPLVAAFGDLDVRVNCDIDVMPL